MCGYSGNSHQTPYTYTNKTKLSLTIFMADILTSRSIKAALILFTSASEPHELAGMQQGHKGIYSHYNIYHKRMQSLLLLAAPLFDKSRCYPWIRSIEIFCIYDDADLFRCVCFCLLCLSSYYMSRCLTWIQSKVEWEWSICICPRCPN